MDEIVKTLESMSPTQQAEKVKDLESWAYSLGLDEARETQRGRALNILQVPPPPSTSSTSAMQIDDKEA